LGVSTPEQITSLKAGVPQQAGSTRGELERLLNFSDKFKQGVTARNPLQALTGVLSGSRDELSKSGVDVIGLERNIQDNMGVGGIDKFIQPKIKELESQVKNADLRAFGGNLPNMNNMDRINKLLQAIDGVDAKSVDQQLNTQGGTVNELKSQIDQLGSLRESNQGLSQSISSFNSNASTLAQTLSAFPSEVGHNINGKVEVVINGAQVLQNLTPEIASMIEDKISVAINDFTRNNFPQLRPTGPNKEVRPRDTAIG
jgi:uncharacterized phage infection (PIP) family protein YhgE